jgi:hypothetical protein
MEDTVLLILLHLGLLATVFLLVLNGHLRRRNKTQIDVVLGVLWFNLLVVGFIFFGWGVGITSFMLSLFYALMSKPMAVHLARRLLGYFTTFHAPWSSPVTDLSGDALLAHFKETERRIIPIAQRPSITKVLSKNDMKAENLREQFHFLLDIGLGVVAREVISNGRQLNRLLILRRRNLAPEKIASRLIRWQWYVFVLHIGLFDDAVHTWSFYTFRLLELVYR